MAFEYDNYNRLVRYGGTNVITYDSNDILYPVSIGNKSLIWTNKKLYKFIDGDNVETTFSYNEDGQRIIKTSNGTRYDYNYDINVRLISERRTINNVVTTYLYYYDESDRLIGYSRNNEMFFYLKDAQGVIYAIINSVGNIVARYTYDAYGKILTSTGTEANNNFIRYKGYYYDVETQLFYCNSRYYSPELCRWISPDSIEYLDPQSINGLNLYAYCGNDPVNYYDPSGHSPEWWQWLISGLEVAAGIALCFVPGMQGFGVTLIGTGAGSMINGYINESNGGSFGAGWWGGQVSGFISAIPGIGVPLGAFIGSITTDWIDYGWEGIDLNKALVTSFIAWGASLFPTMIGEFASKFNIYDKAIYFVNAYNTILTSTANSIVNVYWRGKNIEKKRY